MDALTEPFNWQRRDLVCVLLYLSVLAMAASYVLRTFAVYQSSDVYLLSFGAIGLWRYCWWLNHVVRSLIFAHGVFPAQRARANELWGAGWRPKRLMFMMTTFQELPATTAIVLQSILAESREVGVPVMLFIGTGTASDEQIISAFFAQQLLPTGFEVIMVRQKLPGKRYAIGETLRAMLRQGLTADDHVIFMDGDTYFMPGCLRLCLPFFQLYPTMQALTTHEAAEVLHGPLWVKKWLELRFAQRDFTMQSYALSKKILTLTGRMSIFRGKHLCEPGFIEIIENDHLTHWLWGEYRFLSGDDKSTWYYLLKQSADMLYIPDAKTITIEAIRGSAIDRMKENLRRWSGNTLRNGARAIALGPRRVGFFIWWCLLDQRLTIWTMLIGHMTIISLALSKHFAYLLAAILWIAFSRLGISCVLFKHARRIDMSFPFLLYVNQLMTTLTKITILFRLPQQRWKNRGDQSVGFDKNWRLQCREWMAVYLTLFYCSSCLLFVLLAMQLVSLPNWADLKFLWMCAWMEN